MKTCLMLLSVMLSAAAVSAEVPAYMVYTEDGAIPIYLTTNGIGGGSVPLYQAKTYSNALPVIVKGLEGHSVAAGILTNINVIYFTDGSSIMTGGSLHVTGRIVSDSGITVSTNIEDKITLLAWQEDPLGSQVTQALVTVTNGWTMGPGLMWTNHLGTVTNEITGLFTELTNINAAMSYELTINSTNYVLFQSSNTLYHIALGYDETLVDCASNAVAGLPGTYYGYGTFYSNAALTVNATTNVPFLVTTNSTYTVVTNTLHSTSNSFYYVFDGETNYFGDIATATNATYIAAVDYANIVTQGCQQTANEIAIAGAPGLLVSPDSSGTNAYFSNTVPGVTFSNDISATGADFTAMPTSADTPDGTDVTELVNVDYAQTLTNATIVDAQARIDAATNGLSGGSGGQTLYDAVVPDDYPGVREAMAAGKYTIFVRPGTYTSEFTTAMTDSQKYYITGGGKDNTTINFRNTSTTDSLIKATDAAIIFDKISVYLRTQGGYAGFMKVDTTANRVARLEFYDCYVNYINGQNGQHGSLVSGATDTHTVTFKAYNTTFDCDVYEWFFAVSEAGKSPTVIVDIDNCIFNIDGDDTIDPLYIIYINPYTGGLVAPSMISIRNTQAYTTGNSPKLRGIHVNSGSGTSFEYLRMENNHFEAADGYALFTEIGANHIDIANNYFDFNNNSSEAAIEFNFDSATTLGGGRISGNVSTNQTYLIDFDIDAISTLRPLIITDNVVGGTGLTNETGSAQTATAVIGNNAINQ